MVSIRALGLSLGLTLAAGAAMAQDVKIPKELSQPGDQTVLVVKGEGSQIHVCSTVAGGKLEWVYQGPRASLKVNNEAVGRLQTGPIWTHDDKSSVTGGKVVASVPGETVKDWDWQRFDVTAKGPGILAEVSSVIQLNS